MSNSEKAAQVDKLRNENPGMSVLEATKKAGIKYATYYTARKQAKKDSKPKNHQRVTISIPEVANNRVIILIGDADALTRIMEKAT